jgi:hypothetical protein
VLFANEENRLRGGIAYAAARRRAVAAIETDLGSGTLTWSATGVVRPAWLRASPPRRAAGRGAAKRRHLPLENQGVLCVGLRPDLEAYFDHHTHADTLDKVGRHCCEAPPWSPA